MKLEPETPRCPLSADLWVGRPLNKDSVIADTHHIVAKQLFLILYIFEEGLKNVSGVQDPDWF